MQGSVGSGGGSPKGGDPTHFAFFWPFQGFLGVRQGAFAGDDGALFGLLGILYRLSWEALEAPLGFFPYRGVFRSHALLRLRRDR